MLLKYLGVTFDDVAENSGLGESTCREFFSKWLTRFCQEPASVYIRVPSTPDEISKVTSLYSALGFPGCIGYIFIYL